MSEPVGYQGEMHTVWRMRPCNCDPRVGVDNRCPHCRQHHLRPGYCQALDPINAAQYAVDKSVDTPVDKPMSTPDLSTNVDTTADNMAKEISNSTDPEERRKHYQAEWVRRKREAKA